jgi:hypothetical protein
MTEHEVLEHNVVARHRMIRVFDKQEDYLYPASWFAPIDLPVNLERAILELVAH